MLARLIAIGWVACSVSVHAEVVVELGSHPIEHQRPRLDAVAEGRLGGATQSVVAAEAKIWFTTFVIDRSAADRETTLVAVRNEHESAVPAQVTLEYFDDTFFKMDTETVMIAREGVFSRNLRDRPAIGAPGVRSIGLVRITPQAAKPISADVIWVDSSENFANANHGFVFPDSFCDNWMIRFLRFPGAGGSVMTFLVNGPRGLAPNPPTVSGNVYDEAGNFLNSFTIRTDRWVFERVTTDLVIGGAEFGSMEIVIDAEQLPEGFVHVGHNAAGRFSVDLSGVCRD